MFRFTRYRASEKSYDTGEGCFPQLQRIEKEISRTEAQIAALEEECERYATDYQKLMELEAQKDTLNSELLDLYERWEALSDGYAEAK